MIITGGIDLSVGSVMGLVGDRRRPGPAGRQYPWWLAMGAGLAAGLACGAVNGFFVAYVGLPSFVVTLGMLSIARSLAVVLSQNQMIYQFGPDARHRQRDRRRRRSLGIANPGLGAAGR